MVAREGLALQDNLVPALDVWLVESRHQQVKVGRQRLHDGHLGLSRADDGSHELGGPRISV
jgi:hypothetical protein